MTSLNICSTSMTYGILTLIHGSHDLGPTCAIYHRGGNVEKSVEGKDNRDPERDKVPLGDNRGATHGKMYFRRLIWISLMYPPFWFSTLKYKKAMLIFTGRKILKITISGSFITSSELSHTISTLDSTACNIEGQIKLIDRLSSPSNRLIHHISHPSEE